MDYISFLNDKRVYIWGAWKLGCILFEELSESGIETVAFIDGKRTGQKDFFVTEDCIQPKIFCLI